MPIYVIKPYEVKEEEYEAIAEEFFTAEEKSDDTNRDLATQHEIKIRKRFIDGSPEKARFPYIYEWIERFDNEISLEELARKLDSIDASGANVALLQADLELGQGKPFRKVYIRQNSLEKFVLFDIDELKELTEGLSDEKGISRLEKSFQALKKQNPIFQDAQFLVRPSSSFGLKEGLRLHVFAKLKAPSPRDELKRWMAANSFDASIYDSGHLWYAAAPSLIRTEDPFRESESRYFITGEGELELDMSNLPMLEGNTSSNSLEPKILSDSREASSLEQLQNVVLSNKENLKGQRNELFYRVISRAVDLGLDDLFIDWIVSKEKEIKGDWTRKELLRKRDDYIKWQLKILHSSPIRHNKYFEGGIYRFNTTDLKNHADEIIKLARSERVLIAIKSDMGTGKTELMRVFSESLEKEEIIRTGAYISPRRAISDANGGKVGMTFMLPKDSGKYVELSPKDKKGFFNYTSWVATTDISIRLDETPRDIVIFDELHKTLAALADDGCKTSIDYLLNAKLLAAKVIVILDADMDNELVGRFVEKAVEFETNQRQRKAYLIENGGSHHHGRENLLIRTPAQALSFAFAQIKQGKRVFIHTDHSDKKGKISTWKRLLEEKMMEEGIEGFGAAFDADTAPMEIRGDEREEWYLHKLNEGLKFTIHSPFTNYGWDLLLEEDNHFEVSLGIYTHGWSQANVIKQGGGRARRASLCGYCVWGKIKPKRGDDGKLIYPNTYLDDEEAAKMLEKALSFEESLTNLQKEFLRHATIKKQLGLVKPLFGLIQLIRNNQEVYRWLDEDLSDEYRYIKLTEDDYEITRDGMNYLFMADEKEMNRLAKDYTNLDVSDIDLENIGSLRGVRDGFRADMISEFALLAHTLRKEDIPEAIDGSSYFNYPRLIRCLLKETYTGFEKKDFTEWLRTNEESFQLMYSKDEREKVEEQLGRLGGLSDSIKTKSFKVYLVNFFEAHHLVVTYRNYSRIEWTKLYEEYREHCYGKGFRKSWKAEAKKNWIKADIEQKIRRKEKIEAFERDIAIKELGYHFYTVEKPDIWLKRVCQVTDSRYLATHYR